MRTHRNQAIKSSVLVGFVVFFFTCFITSLDNQISIMLLLTLVIAMQFYSLRFGRNSYYINYKIVFEENSIHFLKRHNFFNIYKQDVYSYKSLDIESEEKGSLFTLSFKNFNGFCYSETFEIQSHKEKWTTSQLKEIEQNIKKIKETRGYEKRL